MDLVHQTNSTEKARLTRADLVGHQMHLVLHGGLAQWFETYMKVKSCTGALVITQGYQKGNFEIDHFTLRNWAHNL